MRRKALTLLELVVVFVIIAIISGIALSAIVKTREGARKISCSGNLRQLGIAIANYESTHGMFPLGNQQSYSFLVTLLPFIEEENRYDSIDFEKRSLDHLGASWTVTPRLYLCPSDPFTNSTTSQHACNYVGINGGTPEDDVNNGVIITGSLSERRRVRAADIIDGLSNTLCLSETGSLMSRPGFGEVFTGITATVPTSQEYSLPVDLKSFSDECFSDIEFPVLHNTGLGYYWPHASLGITRFNCIFPSQPRNCLNKSSQRNALLAPSGLHTGGVYCCFADGAVRFIRQSIATEIWQGLGTRNGGEVISSNW